LEYYVIIREVVWRAGVLFIEDVQAATGEEERVADATDDHGTGGEDAPG